MDITVGLEVEEPPLAPGLDLVFPAPEASPLATRDGPNVQGAYPKPLNATIHPLLRGPRGSKLAIPMMNR